MREISYLICSGICRVSSGSFDPDFEGLLFSAMLHLKFESLDETGQASVSLEGLHVQGGDQVDDPHSTGHERDVIQLCAGPLDNLRQK